MEYVLAGKCPKPAVFKAFRAELKSTLQSANKRPAPQQAWDSDLVSSKILLWISFIGRLMTTDTGERQWYAARICHCMVTLRLDSWEEVRVCLAELLWTDKMYDRACGDLWEEVQRSVAYDGD